jgi:hypothetical protein
VLSRFHKNTKINNNSEADGPKALTVGRGVQRKCQEEDGGTAVSCLVSGSPPGFLLLVMPLALICFWFETLEHFVQMSKICGYQQQLQVVMESRDLGPGPGKERSGQVHEAALLHLGFCMPWVLLTFVLSEGTWQVPVSPSER